MTETLSLRALLRLDAITCLACGLALSLGAGPLGALFGLPPALLLGAGLALLPCAGLMALAMRRPSRALVGLILAGNWAWAAASLAVLALTSPTALGAAFVLAQAALVAAFAWAEARAARAAAAA